MASFDRSITYVLTNEGGYVNDPADAGGQTNFGVTQVDLARWRRTAVTEADMRALQVSEVKRIYHSWWWTPLNLDRVESPNLATCIFDIAVSRGVAAGGKCLQRVLNAQGAALKIDGMIGLLTIDSISKAPPNDVIRGMAALVRKDYELIAQALPVDRKFLAGWRARADRLLTLIDEDQVA